jgi:hypothetical protein
MASAAFSRSRTRRRCSPPRFALTWMLSPPYGKLFEVVLKVLKKLA